MPTIPVYLPDKIYWKVCMEAEKMGESPGKFIGLIVKSYIEFLEKEGKKDAEKKV